MVHNPFKIVQMFEEEVANYTGAKYAVAVDSCTSALFLCMRYYRDTQTYSPIVTIPSKTYLSVPQSIIHAGFKVNFDESLNDWKGIYQLAPYPIYDAAKRFTSGMYIEDSFMCLSFHIKKHLKIGKGGMILTNDTDAVEWFKKARYEGRSEVPYKQDNISMMGWNMYMTPVEGATGLSLMQDYPEHVDDLTETYKDLTENDLFNEGG